MSFDDEDENAVEPVIPTDDEETEDDDLDLADEDDDEDTDDDEDEKKLGSMGFGIEEDEAI